MQCYRHGFEHRSIRERQILRKTVNNMPRHGDELGKGTSTAVVCAGNAQHLALVAKIDFALQAKRAHAAEDGGIENYAVALGQIRNPGAQGGDRSRCLVPHNKGRYAAARGSIVPMHVTAANSAGRNTHEDLIWAWSGCRHFRDFKMTVL